MNENQIEKTIDINRIITIVLSRWYIFIAAIGLSLAVAYLHLRYATPVYQASIYLRLDDDRNSGINDLFRFGRSGGRIENQMKTELEVLKSRKVALNTLRKLNIDYIYELQGKIAKQKLYPNDFFKIIPVYIDSNCTFNFTIIFKNKEVYDIKTENNLFTFNVSDTAIISGNAIIIQPITDEEFYQIVNVPIKVSRVNLEQMAAVLAQALNTEIVKGTSLYNLSITSDVPEFAIQYINTLAEVYIQEQIENKAQTNEQTLKFIASQLDNFGEILKKSEQELSSFKSANRGVSPEELGKMELSKLIALETEKNIKQLLLVSLDKSIKEAQAAKDKPIEMIILDEEIMGGVSGFQSMLNQLIVERISLLQRYGVESKVVQENNLKIENAKNGLLKSLYVARSRVVDIINNIDERIIQAKQQLTSLPEKELNLINIERNYKVNEKIYSYLLEKRLETMIQRASIVSNTYIVDECRDAVKLSPNAKREYMIALGIAILISVLIVIILRLIHNKITDKEFIESVSKTPVIGVINAIANTEEQSYELQILSSPKSIFSESIRSIRTSMNFILQGQNHKLISVTSTVSGEGKTFCTLNIAASLTLLDYKVIIIGCDLRKPKLQEAFQNVTNKKGLTTYLVGKTKLEETIQSTGHNNLDIITSGPIPPNPSELLQSDKMMQLLNQLKQEYDYVLLDTSPVGLVADSLHLMKLSDLNLYILRANYSKRDFATIPDRIKADNGIEHLYNILNAFDPTVAFYGSIYKSEYGGYYGGGGYYYYGYYGRYGYRYGYGYGYGYNLRKKDMQYYGGYYTLDNTPKIHNFIFKYINKIFKKKS